MNKKLAVTLSGCATLVVLTLSACGGDGGDDTDEWARNVCEQLQPQVERIEAANAAITEASEGNRSAEEVREADSTAFQDVSDAYAALADAVDEAGDPPVDNGTELRENAVTALRGLSDSYAELKESIDGLDTSDQGDFAEGLRDIAEQLQALGQSGDEALSELQSGELGEAMSRQEGCRGPSASASASPEEENGE
ncbi:small secreted protein [Streptomyces sp. NBC_01803]|uniref:small secreted protein n=1 Tax=Streptomyces sp. NBC_01803 TaxID=2975946 RepID=UPI002DDAABEE|nr:small secreted protein [Streptomyces sp. NBC_01803]WSA45507.1 small secreted protein [Streptomyces sp. NBC_01803]